MEPTFIYYSNLTFEGKKNYLINFSNEDSLEGVVFKKNKDYYTTSMACYVDLTVDITKLPIYDLATAILRGGVDYGYGQKERALGKTSRSNLYFVLTNKEEISTLRTLNFLMLKIKNKKTYILTQHTTK